MELKPEPDVEGLVSLVDDVPQLYSRSEQKALSELKAGSRISRAIVTCEKINPSSYVPDSGDSELKKKRYLSLYRDCLARAVCEERWKTYTQCWYGSITELGVDGLRRLQRENALRSICHLQRKSLERCVGQSVSAAIRESDERLNEMIL